jgi:hypothetical protein
VEGKKVTEVELGGLEELDLADVDLKCVLVLCPGSRYFSDQMETYVAKGVDALGGLLDLTAHNLRNELGGELAESAARCLAGHDVDHLLADHADLGRPRVGGLLDLVGASLGEGNAEQAEEVVVGGLDDNVGLDQGLPLADEGGELVVGEVETVEVGQAVLALDLVDAQLDLAEAVVLILLEVGEGSLEDAALEGVVGVLQTGGAVDEGLADTGQLLVRYSLIASPARVFLVLLLFLLVSIAGFVWVWVWVWRTL